MAKKLVRRQAGQADRRQARLSLTDSGRRVHQALFPLVCEINRSLLAPLSGDDVARLDRMLSRMQDEAARLVEAAELPKANRRRGGRARLEMG